MFYLSFFVCLQYEVLHYAHVLSGLLNILIARLSLLKFVKKYIIDPPYSLCTDIVSKVANICFLFREAAIPWENQSFNQVLDQCSIDLLHRPTLQHCSLTCQDGLNPIPAAACILTLIRMACFGPRSYMTLHLQSPIA